MSDTVEPAALSAAQQLRELCGEHYHGLLTREDYRRRRAALLDAVILGLPLPTPVTNHDAGATSAQRHDDTVRRRAPILPPTPDASSKSTNAVAWVRSPLFGLGALIVAALLAVVWWLSTADEPAPAVANDGSTLVPHAVATSPNPLQPAAQLPEAFVERFLQGPGAWTDDAVAVFLFEWDSLTAEQRAGLRESGVFKQFVDDLRERILDERSLGTVAPERGIEGFATLLGLDLDLPKRAAVTVVDAGPQSPALTPVPADAKAAPAAVAATSLAAANPVARVATPVEAPVEVAGARDASVPVANSPTGEAPVVPANAASAARCSGSRATMRLDRRICWDVLASGAKGPDLIVVGPGEFTMGASDDQSARPTVAMRIPTAFAIGKNEVSQAEYQAFCQSAGRSCATSTWPDDDLPMVNVTFKEAADYARWLSAQTRQRYRLPSEAEWEYAARGGTTTRYVSGDQASASQIRFGAQTPISPQKFGSNPFGLIHMAGNVREWVLDGWESGHARAPKDGSARPPAGGVHAVRGGSYRESSAQVGSASRAALDAGSKDDQTGFRVVRELAN